MTGWTLEIGNCVVASAIRFSEHAATDGSGAWIVFHSFDPDVHPQPQAITDLTLAERFAVGHRGDDAAFVMPWSKKLVL